jgi:hypothetical protein
VLAAAVGQVCEDCDRRDLESRGRRQEWRVLCSHPVQVQPLGSDRFGQHNSSANAISADVRNISPSGVGLLHKDRLGGPQFWLHLGPFNGETISLLVERLWQHRLPDGPYQSGGRFMEVAATDWTEELDGAAKQENRVKPSDTTREGSNVENGSAVKGRC